MISVAIYQITQTNFFQNLFFNQVIQQACQDSRLVAIFWYLPRFSFPS